MNPGPRWWRDMRSARTKRLYSERNTPAARPEQVALALEELRRRVDGISQRSESLSARAGVLVASAALVAALQDGRNQNEAILGAVALALVAAAFGIAAIFPGRTAYPSIDDTRAEIWMRADIPDSQWWLVDRLSEQYESAAGQLERRGLFLRGGFVSLGVSILLTAIGIATSAGG